MAKKKRGSKRTSAQGPNRKSRDWLPDWDEYFTGPEEAVDREQVRAAYQEHVGITACELGVGLQPIQAASRESINGTGQT